MILLIRGLYTSATGMLSELTRNDVTANNLANVNTAGFKKDTATFLAFPEMLLQKINYNANNSSGPKVGYLGTGSIVDEVVTIHDPGQLKQTDNLFDMALEGNNFFTIETPGGNRYTKNGSFQIDGNGYLVTSEGNNVLGQNGRIQILGKNLSVNQNGQVSVDGNYVDTLRLTSFANLRTDLKKIGASLFTGNAPQPQTPGRVMQGFLESSNVNAVNEMVDLITIMRAYEANQKAVSAHDSTLDKAVNQVGSLR